MPALDKEGVCLSQKGEAAVCVCGLYSIMGQMLDAIAASVYPLCQFSECHL